LEGAISLTRREYIPVGSEPALTAMDGGNAENAGAIFGLLATVKEIAPSNPARRFGVEFCI